MRQMREGVLKKLIPILALIPLVIMALTPPLELVLDCTINSTFWLWMTFICGFLTFLFLYQKVSVWLKLLVVWCFVSSFWSKAPYMSFTMMWSVIVCAYYYLLCTKIEDWEPVKKCVQAIFFFITLLFIMQLFGKDTLVNFNHKSPVIFGIIGNRMIASTFACTLAPFLLFNPLNWIILSIISLVTWSSGAVLSIGAGLCVYGWMKYKRLRVLIAIVAIVIPVLFAYKTGDFSKSTMRAGRLPIYKKTLELSLKRPQGYGIGTYKILFEYLCGWKIRDQSPGKAWRQTHSDPLQILFETGFPGIILFVGWFVSIIRKIKDPIKLAGIAILLVNMSVHFPTRVCNSVFLILIFLAFCSKGDVCLKPAR